jgi:hypothetical protein
MFLFVIKWPSPTPDTEIRSSSMTFAFEFTVHNEMVRYTDDLIYVLDRYLSNPPPPPPPLGKPLTLVYTILRLSYWIE